MIKKRANNFKLIIKVIKKDNRYKDYKKTFIHRSTRFFLTYYIVFYKKSLDAPTIIELEFELMKILKSDNPLMNLSSVSNKLELILKGSKIGNVKSLFQYFYFVYETSRYYYDKKHKIKNIFFDADYIKLNSDKRDYYYEWIKSIKSVDPEFNKVILYIKKRGI